MIEVLVLIALLLAWFFLPAFESSTKPPAAPVDDWIPVDSDEVRDQIDEEYIPSVFVSEDLLPSNEKNCALNDEMPFVLGSEFLINGEAFKENLEIEKFRNFEVYSNNIKMEDNASHSGTSFNDDVHLQIYTQNLPNGILINANVYLTHAQWNTIVCVSQTTYNCIVCGVYCNEAEHINLESHKVKLDMHKPLERYDLSITRKIGDYYHCAVCNIFFNKINSDDHFSSKEHEGKMLFAINKASDIMYDYDVHAQADVEPKKDIYHYNARAINHYDNHSSDNDDETPYSNNDKLYGLNYDDENEDDEDDEHFYDNVEPLMGLEHSYASMARRPKTDDLPKVLEIDLGNKKVTVKYDSWNMVISPKLNKFYCMVCTQFDHIRRKAEHCRSEEHLERLERCKVVEKYEKYLVRQVDDKLYHCGHCNNLQLVNEIEDHIVSQHPAIKTTSYLDSPVKKPPSTPLRNFKPQNGSQPVKNIKVNLFRNDDDNQAARNGNHDDKPGRSLDSYNQDCNSGISDRKLYKTTHQLISLGNSGNLSMYHDLRLANSNMDDDIVICAYGSSVRISKLAYNIVCGRNTDFYCGLCEVIMTGEDLKPHVNDLQHLILLQRTPFLEAFNIHLYRQIRDALHCALCNELIQLIPDIIIRHKSEAKHIHCLSRALSNLTNEQAALLAPFEANDAVKKPTADNTAKTVLAAPKDVKVTPNNVLVAKSNEPITKEEIPYNTSKLNTSIATNSEKLAPHVTEDVKIASSPIQTESTEFIEVKNGMKDETIEESTDEAMDDSFDTPFDLEEYLYVKMGNTYIKITNSSYNTLVNVGDGTKYCFVCSTVVNGELLKHVESRGHMENMEKNKFVDKYKEDLLRQIYLMYHCSICNVLITRKQVNHHLSWPTHALQTENTKISAKQRKNEIKSGIRQVTASTQKENIYLNENETKIQIILNIAICKDTASSVVRNSKIVIFNDNVLKISFDHWHSLSVLDKGWRCKVCQCDLESKEFASHVTSDWHKSALERIEKQYSPALIRKINDNTLNCIICNTEVSNKSHIIQEHIQGKKHLKNYDNILKESSVANSYADCDQDVLML